MRKIRLAGSLGIAAVALAACDGAATAVDVNRPQPPMAVRSDILGAEGPAIGGPSLSKAGVGGPVKITILEEAAPNVFGSPSFAGWVQNAIVASRTSGPAGTPNTPEYFEDIQNAGPADFVATGFVSWQGEADAVQAFGPAFARELGNRMHWVTRVVNPARSTR
jgi:hypothetical protein